MGLLKDLILEAHVKVIAIKIGKLLKVDKRLMGVFFASEYVRTKVEVQENVEEIIPPVEMEEASDIFPNGCLSVILSDNKGNLVILRSNVQKSDKLRGCRVCLSLLQF
ncbi:hypothetical protein TorRG33x02_197670 [Trema orientale]|uniref:Uncharacterized protein n=1 Tax=Trema orientale TaxID=63057 RepID=A0A2P5EFZ9_TREOI|nr:hypothetical protein TorRG33x02_197670 [Trema orientale]